MHIYHVCNINWSIHYKFSLKKLLMANWIKRNEKWKNGFFVKLFIYIIFFIFYLLTISSQKRACGTMWWNYLSPDGVWRKNSQPCEMWWSNGASFNSTILSICAGFVTKKFCCEQENFSQNLCLINLSFTMLKLKLPFLTNVTRHGFRWRDNDWLIQHATTPTCFFKTKQTQNVKDLMLYRYFI